jgi:hypothetical protein
MKQLSLPEFTAEELADFLPKTNHFSKRLFAAAEFPPYSTLKTTKFSNCI